jgi:hypothetical protein
MRKHAPEILIAIFTLAMIAFLWNIWNTKNEARLTECKGHVEECREEDREARSKLPRSFRSAVPKTDYREYE